VPYAFLRKKKPKKEAAAAAEPTAKRAVKRRAKKRPVYWIGYTDHKGDPQQIPSPARHTDYPLALAEAVEIERREREIRDGVKPAISAKGVLFKSIADRYIKVVIAGLESKDIDEGRIRNHLLPRFGEQLASAILPTEIDEHLLALQDAKLMLKLPNPPPEKGKPPYVRRVQSAKSAHNIRCLMSGIYEYARDAMKMKDLENPVTDSRAIEVQKPRPTPLPLEWIEPLLAKVPRHYFCLFVVALFTGFRRGELAGMKVSDLDLATGMLHCRGTFGKATNKSKKDRSVPISERLRPLLQNHVAGRSPDEHLFTMPEGSVSPKTGEVLPERPLTKDIALPEILRSALKAAGIVSGYEVFCKKGRGGRRGDRQAYGCGFSALRAVADYEERCPNPMCKRQLWVRTLEVDYSFKDLRSTFATWIARTAGDIRAATILLGHSSVQVTEDSYAELLAEQLRPEINQLPFAPELTFQTAVGQASGKDRSAGPDTLLTPEGSTSSAATTSVESSPLTSGTYEARPTGIEPVAFGFEAPGNQLRSGNLGIAGGSRREQPGAKTQGSAPPPHRAVAAGSSPERSRTYTSLTPSRPQLRVLDGGGERLLTPQQVAKLLCVHPSTVHQAIRRGDFGEVLRFGSSFIRIRASDLEAFLARSATTKGKP
jgi:excisionase family DNA binding protein